MLAITMVVFAWLFLKHVHESILHNFLMALSELSMVVFGLICMLFVFRPGELNIITQDLHKYAGKPLFIQLETFRLDLHWNNLPHDISLLNYDLLQSGRRVLQEKTCEEEPNSRNRANGPLFIGAQIQKERTRAFENGKTFINQSKLL